MTLAPQALEAGREALAKVDRALAERPHKDDYVLSDASEALCTLREGLIAEAAGETAPEGPAHVRLETLNAILGVVLGVHFPIGPTPWDDLEAARGWLAELVTTLAEVAEVA